jgi:hypothetical protein
MSVTRPDRYYLLGDEDAGVGLHCLDCDTGGIPVIYYGDSYPDPAIQVTQSIDEFFSARGQHDMKHPADADAAFPRSNVTVRNGKEGGL